MSNSPKPLQIKDLRRFDLPNNWARMTDDILLPLYKHKDLHPPIGWAVMTGTRSLDRLLRPELFNSYKRLPYKDLR